MKSSRDATIFMDLSFLSVEEEGIIRQVLLRDENLKRLEIGRVRRLRNSILDPKQLKVLSGEWFEEIRAKRHGRQPDISAVMRSSMRWKKTAGHKPNPFLLSVTEEKEEGDRERGRTCAGLSDDPRSVHPALSIKECRAYTDEDIVLDDEIQSVHRPAKNVHFEKPSQIPSKEHTEKQFIIRTFADCNIPILSSPDPVTKATCEPINPSAPVSPPQLKPVLEQKTNSAATTHTTTNGVPGELRQKALLPLAEHKNTSREENLVKTSLEANKTGPTEVKIRPKLTDGRIPDGTLEMTSFSDIRGDPSLDQSCQLDTEQNTKSEVEDGKIMSSSKVVETEEKSKQRHTPCVFVKNQDNAAFEKEAAASQTLHGDPQSVHEPLTGAPRGQDISAEMMKMPASPSNTEPQIQNERPEIEKGEIPEANFRRSSPTRMDVLSIDSNMEENPEDQRTDVLIDLNVSKDAGLDLNQSEGADTDILTEVVVKDAGPGRKGDFDMKRRDFGSADKKPSESKQTNKIQTAGELCSREPNHAFSEMADVNISVENRRSESDILAGVYERALRAKSNMSKNTFTQNTKQEKAEIWIPTIVIMSPESEDLNQAESLKKEPPGSEVARPAALSFVADVWEDEGVESEDDSSSVSSCGSDHSRRRPISASTLSVTERSGSLLSVYSDAGDFGNVAVQGSVEFALMYSPLGEIVIMVEQCQDLAIANQRKQRTDPYVKTYLYPDKRSKRKTSIKKRTVNPVYVESLRYKVKREELPTKTLNLSVWHSDPRGRNVFLGQVELNLRMWDWKHEALTWYNLQPKSKDNLESQESCGLLSLSLKYVPPESTGGSKPSTGELHIWLREARRLRRLKSHCVSSFMQCYMLPDTSKKRRQKTRVVKKSQDPVYNHAMVYDGFRPGEVREACCELTVWDNNKFSNQFLGGVRIGLGTGQSYGKKVDWMDSTNEEVEIWEKMLESPNSWVEAELSLRASMTPRK